MGKPEGERIASLEAHMIDQDRKLEEIATDIKDIKTVLQAQLTLSIEIATLKEQIGSLKKSANIWKVISPAVAAAFATLLTVLMLSYLDKLK